MATERAQRLTRKRVAVFAAAAVLFAVVFALRLAAGDDTGNPVLVLALLPVTLLAVELGIVAGLAGSLVVLAMLIGWVTIEDVSLD